MKAPPRKKERLGGQAEAHAERTCLHGTTARDAVNPEYDIVLPAGVRMELLRRAINRRPRAATKRQRLEPRVSLALLIVAAISSLLTIGWIAAFGAIGRHAAPSTSPPVPVQAQPPAVPLPTTSQPQLYREWVPQNGGGWILVYGDCTPARSDFFQPDPAPRAMLAVSSHASSELRIDPL